MDMKIEEEKENPFLNLTVLMISIKHENLPTPSKIEIIKNIAAMKGVDETQVVASYVMSKKGIGESVVKVKILKEKPEVKKVEAQSSPAEQTA